MQGNLEPIGTGRLARDGSCHPGRSASLSCPAMTTETQTVQLWICTSCGFIYDPEEGDPDGGIPPGTPFDEIPDDWFCPVWRPQGRLRALRGLDDGLAATGPDERRRAVAQSRASARGAT